MRTETRAVGAMVNYGEPLLCEAPENVDAAAVRRLVLEAAEGANCENWDDEGAEPVTAGVIEHAVRIADWIAGHALPIPSVEPDPGGRLCFVWGAGKGRIGAVEAKPDGTLFVTCYDRRMKKNEYGSLPGPLPPESFAEGVLALYDE